MYLTLRGQRRTHPVFSPAVRSGDATPRRCGLLLRILYQHTHTHTHTHPFNGSLSGTTLVSRYQKGKTYLNFTEAKDGEWQWHQLGRMQVCRSLQTDNHASSAPLNCVATLLVIV